jgi:hypothetical protein
MILKTALQATTETFSLKAASSNEFREAQAEGLECRMSPFVFTFWRKQK